MRAAHKLLPALLAVAAGAACALAAPPADTARAADVAADAALGYRAGHLEAFRDDLLQLARFPSVSALPAHAGDVLAAAEWLRSKLQAAGLSAAQVLPTRGPQPVVYAEHLGAGSGAPTILIYGHYDVQPADPAGLWDTPPFEPVIRGGYFQGRGVDDDKGGALNPVHAVESYLRSPHGALPVNVKFLIEGQEEMGSPDLDQFLRDHAALFAGVDLALSADGGQISEEQPAIVTGLRGAAALQVDLRTAATDMHSGVKGGSVQNAAHALVQLLATLRDPDTGRILVEGFYDGVVEPDGRDQADMKAFPHDADGERAALGIEGYMGEAGRSTLERRWHRPTLEVVGMGSGFQGDGIKTIVPCTATAKLSARLVPGQTPGDITDKIALHLQRHAPQLTAVTATPLGFRSVPWVSPRNTPGNHAAAAVLRPLMGREPLYMRDGGTIPALAYFQDILGVPTTVFSFSLGERIHAPNERLKVSMFDRGSEGWIRLIARLGGAGRDGLRAGAGGGGGSGVFGGGGDGGGIGEHRDINKSKVEL